MKAKRQNIAHFCAALGAVALCTGPAQAQAWETWQVAGETVAGYCSAEADETCLEVACNSDGLSLAMISLGAWSVTKGAKMTLTLMVDGKDVQLIDGTIEDPEGFGPEFFATRGAISASTLTALKQGSAAALVFTDGYVLDGFDLSGSQAVLEQAGC